MVEMFAVYRHMAPLPIGLLLIPLGLAIGSFSSVLLHRLPERRSLLRPRSHCPHCRHSLAALDLVPVLSFLWNGGRCRYCRTSVSPAYLLLELGCALGTAGAGAAGGWLCGFAFLLAWLGITAAVGLRKRGPAQAAQEGFTLVEVLVAVMLLVMVTAPALDAISVASHGDLAAQRRSLAIGVARARINQLAQMGADNLARVDAEHDTNRSAGAIFSEPSLQEYFVLTMVDSAAGTGLRGVTVTVSCPTCRAQYGLALKEVTLSSVIRRESH